MTKAYLRNYRTDGTLESEGYALFFDHPVADYSMEEKWRFYECNQKISKVITYNNGVEIIN